MILDRVERPNGSSISLLIRFESMMMPNYGSRVRWKESLQRMISGSRSSSSRTSEDREIVESDEEDDDDDDSRISLTRRNH